MEAPTGQASGKCPTPRDPGQASARTWTIDSGPAARRRAGTDTAYDAGVRGRGRTGARWRNRPGRIARAACANLRGSSCDIQADSPPVNREPGRGHGEAVAADRAQTPEDLRGPLLGRDRELAELCQLLAPGGPTVVNVTGMRGIGKSALVDAALERVGQGFGDVMHLDLTGAAPTAAMSTIRRFTTHLPVPLRRAKPNSHHRSLLVLDQSDVLAAQAQTLTRFAAGVDALTVLVMSVQQLRSAGCTPLLVSSLHPDAAAALFRREAEAVGIALSDAPATEASVRRVCESVDGNPLAIELATARLPLLGLPGLESALSSAHALSILSSPARAVRSRRQVGALLPEHEHRSSAAAQQLMELLSVFAGSFTLEAAEAVSAGVVEPCFDALTELIDQRLVELETPADLDGESGRTRYRLRRLFRAFAAVRLKDSDLDRVAHAQHAQHYVGVARRAAAAIDDADEDTALRILGGNYVEAQQARQWLAEHDPAAALRLAADLSWECHRRGSGDAQTAVLEDLYSRVGACGDDATRRDALLWLVQLRGWSPGAVDRAEHLDRLLDEAMSLARAAGEPLPLLRGLRTSFLTATALGDLDAARATCSEGVQLSTDLGHARWLGRFEVSLGSVHALLRQQEQSVRLTSSGLDRALRSRDLRTVVSASLALHAMPPELVPDRGSVPSLEQVLAMTRELHDVQAQTNVLARLAHAAIERGDATAAARWAVTRQEHLGRSQLLHGLTVSIMLAVHVARLRGDVATSARLHGSVRADAEAIRPLLGPDVAALYDATLQQARDELGADPYDALVGAGRVLSADEATEEMMAYLYGVVDTSGAADGYQPSPSTRHEQDRGHPATALTAREQQVLTLLAAGCRNKEIAAQLRVTPKTVMHHTGAIYRKLGVRGRAEAVMTAARLGLVPLQ